MFNLIGLGEHAGSGVPDIYHAWKEVGLAEPVVEEKFGEGNPDRTILTLPLVTNVDIEDTGDGLSHSAIDSDISLELLLKILEFCNTPRTRAEIMELCGYKSIPYFRRKILNPLIVGGQIVPTIPDKPNSPKQKYIRRTAIKA